MTRLSLIALASILLIPLCRLQAQEGRDFQAQLERAIEILEGTDTERGVTVLSFLIEQFESAPVDLRAIAHLRLGEALWALGSPDSARQQFQRAVASDPFVRPDPELFNPDLMNAYEFARSTTVAVGSRAPADTTLDPLSDRLPLEFAVGRSGQLSIWLRRSDVLEPYSLIATLQVDDVATHDLSLLVGDSVPLGPGSYSLIGVLGVGGEGADTAELEVMLVREAVDTLAHAPLDSSRFLPQYKKGPPLASSLLRGVLIGAAVGAIPAIISSSDLGNDSFEPRAIAVGATITIAGFTGAMLGRPDVPIDQNIVSNQQLVSAWERRNEIIASENAARTRLAPVAITAVRKR